MDPETKPLYDKLVDANGKPRVHENVHIAAFSRTDAWGRIGEATEKHGPLTVGYGGTLADPDKLGPELGFGVTMHENLKEPILLIKTAWGGKSLRVDFRPPSAGPVTVRPEDRIDRKNKKGEVISAAERIAKTNEATGRFYRLMLEHVRTVLADPGKYRPAYAKSAGYEISGLVWFQGFNDLVGDYPLLDPGSKKGGKDYSEYSHLLACLIRDVRRDLSVPNMPFTIGVLGVGGEKASENTVLFRKAMAAPADMEEFKGTVTVVHTAGYWDEKLGELEARKSFVTRNKRKHENEDAKSAAIREKAAPLKNELDALEKQKDKTNKAKIDELKKQIQEVLYTPEELDYIAKNRSNAAYHYLGSAKIYSRIGEALAHATLEMRKSNK
jgi:alpha-galactosidase